MIIDVYASDVNADVTIVRVSVYMLHIYSLYMYECM